jgi:hypothetical protein
VAKSDPMFSSRTDAELMRMLSGMRGTASELGVSYDKRRDFADRKQLVRHCVRLHDKIVAFRTGLDAADDPMLVGERAGIKQEKSTVRHDDTETPETTQATTEQTSPTPKPKPARKRAAPKTAGEEKSPAEQQVEQGRSNVAKSAKKSAAKKTSSKKVAKKTASKKTVAKKSVAKERVPMSGRMVIRWKLAKKRMDGQTVEKYTLSKGARSSLASAVRKGWAALEEPRTRKAEKKAAT